MIYTQKYSLVSFIESVDVDYEFNMQDWPLHVTLADVFSIDRKGTNIVVKLMEMLSASQPVPIEATDDSVLGVTSVILLKKDDELVDLHEMIIDILESNGAVFNNPEFTREGFLPHSTIQKNGRLNSGDKNVVDSISLIDMYPDNDWKEKKL